MRYRLFGPSGLRVSEIALGTMTFGPDWGWGADAAESRRMFDRFAEAGGNFVDTASNYTDGSSESILGDCLQSERDRFVVATKYTLTLDGDDPNAGGNHRKSLVRALEQSLRRLKTDFVDVLWMHMRDPTTPIEEVVRALDDQVRAGKVLYVGISDSPAWVAAQANTLAALRGWTPFVGLQLPYSLAARDPERELLPMAAAFGLTVTAWGVLEHGMLAGREPSSLRFPEESVPERVVPVVETIAAIARERGCTPSQVAIAWLLRRTEPEIIPIIGSRTVAQLEENLGALAFVLSDEERARLNAAGEFKLGFPRAFLESDDVRELIYGETWGRLTPVA